MPRRLFKDHHILLHSFKGASRDDHAARPVWVPSETANQDKKQNAFTSGTSIFRTTTET